MHGKKLSALIDDYAKWQLVNMSANMNGTSVHEYTAEYEDVRPDNESPSNETDMRNGLA